MTDVAPTPSDIDVPRVLLWRHGRTSWNAEGRFQGQEDPPLDRTGVAQAARSAPFLAAQLAGEDAVLVSSDLDRARSTAAPLAALLGMPLRLDARLRENGLGCWEGLTREDVELRYPEQYAAWRAGRPVPERGGESPGEVAARAVAALAALPPASTAIVVSHGGTTLRLIEALLELAPEQRRVLGPLGNCCWSELRAHEGRWRLMRHNAAAPAAAEGDPVVTAVAAPAQDADVS